ncbi:conserved hypothetical protein [Beutenbergia cavernae DSM 12333]|uniref:Uncharacterized protein n=1 Tax=Beutenbergia cavernae (strain ATCC BAA-8 / DSM 12333 / CCUG 43141 / JCM 11478 / NBRC 16432 / NCIMB 13614 / HKI 0122) TaxID=471853 RepID=C5C679_BEUC1|nr:hypothetical protein [Beutenbergia cavernae]ACQ80285.1 conserved hypothetical protein [Beutenbergia cavernae DSM 12333]
MLLTIGVVVAALALSCVVGSPLATWVLRLSEGTGAKKAAALRAGEVLRGGLVIGILERLAVTGSILLGHPEGIAVVVAVKGLGRFPELRAREGEQPGVSDAVSERFIIGTLASLCWAAAIGALARLPLN